jgi:NAD-dependent deacetylase
VTLSIQPEILERLRSAKRVVIFSGAGLSAESGIPTFRDAQNSLWTNIDPMAVASIEGFRHDPEKVWAWHDNMRKLFANAGPNAGHEAIAQLEMLLQPAKVQIITQNIDGFHQEAGNTRVLEIHGTTRRIRCHRRCGYVAAWEGDAPHQCPVCSGPVRPDVVWFGEGLDEMLFNLAEEAAQVADIFFAVGTSGVVQPAASLTTLAKNFGAMVVEVNPGKTPQSVLADVCIRVSATEFFQSLTKAVRTMRLRQIR